MVELNFNKKLAYPTFTEDCNLYDLDQDVRTRLSYQLLSMIDGNNEVFVSPVGKNNDPKFILSELDKIFYANSHRLNSTLSDLEQNQRAKFGPRSIALPWKEREKELDSHFGDREYVGDLNAISGIPSLRPLSTTNAVSYLKNDTNSGLPYFTRKGKVKSRVIEDISYLRVKEYPCLLFTRTQESKKTRNVWGYPIYDTLNEMRFYSPLLQLQKTLPYRSALISPDSVSDKITEMLLRAMYNKDMSLISIDFSSYDATVKSELQMLSFKYISSLYQKDQQSDIESIFNRFNTIPLWTPVGIRRGVHGVPSGSTFTNEVDSIAQATIALNFEGMQLKDFQVQGDDGAYILEERLVSSLFAKFERYGLKVNRDKSYTSKEFVIYLQNLYHIDYIKEGKISGIYPIYRALNRIIYQERWQNFEDFEIDGKDYYSIRTISILENCKHHPLFEEFVKLILKFDKYSLDFSDQGLKNYVLMFRQTEGTEEILKHQYGTDATGIKNFDSFKLIKKLIKESG